MTAKWAFICEHAFLDSFQRLGVLGVNQRIVLPKLDVSIRSLVLVAAFDVAPPAGEQVSVSLTITTPSGQPGAPNDPERMKIQPSSDYLVIHLQDMPINEEGVYRFVVTMAEEHFVTVDLPILVNSTGKTERVN